MTSAVIVVNQPVARERFCGRTLVERHEEILRRAGVADVRVLNASALDGCSGRRGVQPVTLFVTAERIFDPRLYAAALARDGVVRITDAGIEVGIETRPACGGRGGPVRGAEGVERVAGSDRADPSHDPAAPPMSIDLRTLDPYSPELRRSIRPYWMRVTGVHDRPAVTNMLVEASGKGCQDLPAMLINAPIEKAALRLLANTRVTPNQITVACNLLAYAVAALFATGHLLSGAIGALVVGIVDGLDGRQARVQLRTTPLGRMEHLFDKVYEVLWIIALAYALSDGFADKSYVTGLLMWTAAYLLDTAAYDLVKWRTGLTLDEASRLDSVIRLIAGRRNVYACVLLAGVLAGQAPAAFRAIVWWSVATAVAHLWRGAMVIRSRRRRVLV
jgi:phosphatidylglycerophosphate synthase